MCHDLYPLVSMMAGTNGSRLPIVISVVMHDMPV